MQFKQIQLFQLPQEKRFSIGDLTTQLEPFIFSPCLSSMPESMGWVSPLSEADAPLLRTINGNIMLCLQIEEKVLPATVIRQELTEAIKQIEISENRKLRQKEKYTLKDDITVMLLPRAFTKLTKVYAYIDNNHHWLVLATTNGKITEKFISIFKKSVTVDISPIELKNISAILTSWIQHKNYPSTFVIEKACVLRDAQNQNRIIRCQQQDLFANSIQSLIKDGCEITQLALSWQDRIHFTLSDNFLLRGIQLQDELLEQIKEMDPETAQAEFDANFFIMGTTFAELFKDLLELFSYQRISSIENKSTAVNTYAATGS